ncbi:hypothetical protein QWZ13_13085 [Reinekea marina]|nr:hypothetical protein [Reinekea marina]MDN3649847.1 hypothetical protein [Reinekea marina]
MSILSGEDHLQNCGSLYQKAGKTRASFISRCDGRYMFFKE